MKEIRQNLIENFEISDDEAEMFHTLIATVLANGQGLGATLWNKRGPNFVWHSCIEPACPTVIAKMCR